MQQKVIGELSLYCSAKNKELEVTKVCQNSHPIILIRVRVAVPSIINLQRKMTSIADVLTNACSVGRKRKGESSKRQSGYTGD